MKERRPATLEEARALAHPLRQRVLRLCLDETLTNKQLADRLGVDPGTLIHHVRQLVNTGFLAAEAVRAGPSGALEKPYRSTGKSWTLEIGESAGVEANLALVDAFRAELAEAGPGRVETLVRLAFTVDKEALHELVERLSEIVEELAARPPDPHGRPYGMLLGIHERAWPARDAARGGEASEAN